MSYRVEEEKPTPAEVRSRLRLVEDHNLAQRLQDEEFHTHYDHNRYERRTVGNDTKQSMTEQEREDAVARENRRRANRHIEETDEEMARRMAAEFESEERRQREQNQWQLRRDEEIARQLAEGSTPTSTPTYNQQLMDQPNPPYSGYQAHALSTPAVFTNPIMPQPPTRPPPPNIGLSTPIMGITTAVPLPGLANPRLPPPMTSSLPTPTDSTPLIPSRPQILSPTNLAQNVRSNQIDATPLAFENRMNELRSQVSIDSPVNWPPPPASVGWHQQPISQPISQNNPFFADLHSQITSLVPNPPHQVPGQVPPAGYNSQMTSQVPAPPSQFSQLVQNHPLAYQGGDQPPPYENVSQSSAPNTVTTFGVSHPPPPPPPPPPVSFISPPQPPSMTYQSEFGLPPPSSLALGQYGNQTNRL